MGSPRPVNLPSGLAGEVRGLKAKEANLLADQTNVRRGTTFNQILAACWLGTDAPGPYAADASKPVNWGQVLVCDRMVALVNIRIATYGPSYAFQLQCAGSACREKFEWEIDLEKDLVIKPLPEASISTFLGGNRFETTFPSTGRKAWFKLQTGDDELKASQQAKARRDRIMTVALAARVVEIEGVHANDRVRFLDDLEMGDAQALIAQLDEVDGGVETNIEVECPHCGLVQEVSLPFGKEFYLPTAKKPKAADDPMT